MYHAFSFSDVLASSAKAAWQVEDVLPSGAKLDFGRRFLPEALARIDGLALLSDDEKRVLNQIRGLEYLTIFGPLAAERRAHLQARQHQASRWACLASGMGHPEFTATPAGLSPAARDRIAAVAPAFS